VVNEDEYKKKNKEKISKMHLKNN